MKIRITRCRKAHTLGFDVDWEATEGTLVASGSTSVHTDNHDDVRKAVTEMAGLAMHWRRMEARAHALTGLEWETD